jgi:bacterioferritin
MAKAAKNTKEERRKKVIEVLNKARAMELLAIHQYMNQHYNLDDKDYGEMAAKIKLIAIDEMRHAESFAERIKELGGSRSRAMKARSKKGSRFRTSFLSMPNSRMTPSMSTTSFCWCAVKTETV